MLTFEKGDPNNLKGKAFLYTHNTGSKNYDLFLNPEYIYSIIAPYPSDVFGVMEIFGPVPEELKQSVKKGYTDRMEMVNESKNEMSKIIEDIKNSTTYADVDFLDSLRRYSEKFIFFCEAIAIGTDIRDRLQEIEYDIIRIPDFSDSINGTNALNSASTIYKITAQEQMIGRIDTKGKKTRMKSYNEMEPQEFKNVFSNLISTLMHDLEYGKEPFDVLADMKQITKNSPFLSDVVNLYGLSKTGKDDDTIETMTLINKRIFAILDNRYEDAAEITKRMKKLGFTG